MGLRCSAWPFISAVMRYHGHPWSMAGGNAGLPGGVRGSPGPHLWLGGVRAGLGCGMGACGVQHGRSCPQWVCNGTRCCWKHASENYFV